MSSLPSPYPSSSSFSPYLRNVMIFLIAETGSKTIVTSRDKETATFGNKRANKAAPFRSSCARAFLRLKFQKNVRGGDFRYARRGYSCRDISGPTVPRATPERTLPRLAPLGRDFQRFRSENLLNDVFKRRFEFRHVQRRITLTGKILMRSLALFLLGSP